MEQIFVILKGLFVVVYLISAGLMANFLFRKSYGNSFYSLVGILATTGVIMTGFTFATMLYRKLYTTQAAVRLAGFGRFSMVVFFIILSVLSYLMYVRAFRKKRYERQQTLVLGLAVLALALACLPQNEYAKDIPGLFLPSLRMIPSVVLGTIVSFVLVVDAYFKQNVNFQIYGAMLFAMQVVHVVYVFVFRANAEKEYFLFALVSLVFLLMIRIFYRELRDRHAMDRY